jgi:gamma-glutamylcyclotransferase (GGCT)/AIG2-like uncharacterized protein YtfP
LVRAFWLPRIKPVFAHPQFIVSLNPTSPSLNLVVRHPVTPKATRHNNQNPYNLTNHATTRNTPPTSRKLIPLFFYGTLQDPTFLRSLPSLPHTPTLRPARLTGYKLKLWSLYPILVPEKGSVVNGVLWAGAKQEEFENLEKYEGNAYKWVEVDVEIEVEVGETPEKVRGEKWNGGWWRVLGFLLRGMCIVRRSRMGSGVWKGLGGLVGGDLYMFLWGMQGESA